MQVIGGGVVGLAIARRLAEREGGRTVLVERHGGVGRESSSRNSEVGFLPASVPWYMVLCFALEDQSATNGNG